MTQQEKMNEEVIRSRDSNDASFGRGAVARPFVTQHNALGRDLYLRIAPELYSKDFWLVVLIKFMK